MQHKNINRGLALLVGLLGLYILVSPYIPLFAYQLHRGHYPTPAYVAAAQNDRVADTNIPNENRIAIPKIGVDDPIIEGTSIATLDMGLWHRPQTPTPLEGGNTVIAGHRFSYNPRLDTPFYNLDKLVSGDEIFIAWDQKIITYRVAEIKTVRPEQVEIEANTKENQLTLYTCTPLWTNRYRLVVIAKQVGEIL